MKRAAAPLYDAPVYTKRLYLGTRQRSYSRSPSQSPTRATNPDDLAEQLQYHTRLPQERRRRSTPESSGTELLRRRGMSRFDWNAVPQHHSRKDIWEAIKNGNGHTSGTADNLKPEPSSRI
ncbi:hypothetical protein Aduo_008455 [Ancylostoma duodenale]